MKQNQPDFLSKQAEIIIYVVFCNSSSSLNKLILSFSVTITNKNRSILSRNKSNCPKTNFPGARLKKEKEMNRNNDVHSSV